MLELADDLLDALQMASNSEPYMLADDSIPNNGEQDTSIDVFDEISSLLYDSPEDSSAPGHVALDLVTEDPQDEVILPIHAGAGVCEETEDEEYYRQSKDVAGGQLKFLQECDDGEMDDDLMKVARDRMKRDKRNSKKCSVSNLNLSLLEKGKKRKNQILGSKEVKDVKRNPKEYEVDLVYVYFEEFRNELKLFNENAKSRTIDNSFNFVQNLEEFVDRIESVYLKGKLGSLTEDEKVDSKVFRLIQMFIRKCRKSKNVDLDHFCGILFKVPKKKILCKFKYWTCNTCGKKDLLFDERKCSVCGRPKRRAQLSTELVMKRKMKDTISEEEDFLAEGKVCDPGSTESTSVTEARVRRQYLFRKVDYDLHTRTGLKNDTERVLNSIKATIGMDGATCS